MEALTIEIINPKAKKILKDLADLNLINISKTNYPRMEFRKLLLKLRSKSDSIPSIEEITNEVEMVREDNYEKKRK